jgi:FtsZ-binding cell division protein ZapB
MDVLDHLEQKIRRTLQDLDALREENRKLGQGMGTATHPADGGADVERLEEELRVLHEERSAVRERVERLIALLEEAP